MNARHDYRWVTTHGDDWRIDGCRDTCQVCEWGDPNATDVCACGETIKGDQFECDDCRDDRDATAGFGGAR